MDGRDDWNIKARIVRHDSRVALDLYDGIAAGERLGVRCVFSIVNGHLSAGFAVSRPVRRSRVDLAVLKVIGSHAERLAAVGAHVRLLACVQRRMDLQWGRNVAH